MGRFKTTEERIAKRLLKVAERKQLEMEASEKAETKPKHPEKIIRRPAPIQDPMLSTDRVGGTNPMIVNFGQDSLRQKKG